MGGGVLVGFEGKGDGFGGKEDVRIALSERMGAWEVIGRLWYSSINRYANGDGAPSRAMTHKWNNLWFLICNMHFTSQAICHKFVLRFHTNSVYHLRPYLSMFLRYTTPSEVLLMATQNTSEYQARLPTKSSLHHSSLSKQLERLQRLHVRSPLPTRWLPPSGSPRQPCLTMGYENAS